MLLQQFFGYKEKHILRNLKILQQHQVSVVNLEGYAYQSSSKAIFQIAEATSILKLVLLQANIKINIISPSELKMYAGKGNYNKFQMLQAFIAQELKDNKFWQNIVKYEKTLYKYNKEKTIINGIKSPFSDAIDAYFLSLI